MAISIIQIDGNEYPLGSSASNVVFNSTGTGIEAGNVQEAIEAVKLRAGDNITIENGVISATGGGSQGGGEEQEGTFAELDVDSRLKHIQSPVMVLDCISQSEEPVIADCPIGGYYCYMGNQASACRIRYRKAQVTAGQYRDIDLSSPQGHVLYYNKAEDKTYHWDGQKLVAVLWHAGLAIDNRLMSSRATAVVLRYISANLDDGETPMGANSGDVYCDSNNHIIVRGGTVNPDKEYVTAASLPTTPDADLGLPDQKLVYYDVNKKGFYRWNGVEWKKALNIDIDTTNLVTFTQLNNTLSSYATKNYVDQAVQQAEQGETVVINSDGANIVDEHNNNSVLLAPSARQMKLMYDNFMAVYNSLANIAFTNGKPSLDWIGTKTKYTLFYGTMTGCTADVAAGQVNEGGLRIKLTPTQSSYAFTSVTVNGESVSTTATGDADGSVYIDIIVNQNITVAATAVSGYNVNIINNNSHCALSPTSIVAGATYNGTLNAEPHYKRPETITATMNGSPITFDGITNSYDKNTGSLKISNVTGDVAITATATILPHITVTFPADHDNMVINHGNGELTGDSVNVYTDDKPYSLTIQPAEGYKFTTAPSATGGTMTHVGNVYTLTIGQSDMTNIVITAQTEVLIPRTISWSGGGYKAYSDSAKNVQIDTTQSITKYDGDTFEAWIVADATYSIDSVSGATYDPTTGKVSIASVSEDVTITVTATTTNSMFAGVKWDNLSYTPIIRAYNGTSSNGTTTVSPLIDIEGVSSLTFNLGQKNGTDNVGKILYFDDKFNDYVGSRTLTNQTVASSGTGTITNAKSIRLQMPNDPEIIYGAWVKDGNDFLFKGEDYVDYDSANGTYTYNSNVRCSFDFLDCNYVPRTQADEGKKIFTGVVPVNMTKNAISVVDVDHIASGYYNTDNQSYFITEWFDLVDGQDICTSVKMNCGETSQKCGLMMYKQNQDKTTSYSYARAYYDTDLGNNTFIKPINTDTTLADAYTKIALLCKVSGIEDCFLELSFDGGTTYNRVWSGASQSNEQSE